MFFFLELIMTFNTFQKSTFATILLLVILAAIFYFIQSHGAMGGAISLPKLVWLYFCIFNWFVFPLLYINYQGADQILRKILVLFSYLMWGRGLAELIMLFAFKSWKPPYGITHDLLCILFFLYWLVKVWDIKSKMPMKFILIFYLSTLVSEIYYAYAFYNLVAGKTVGAHGIWFADATNPIFVFINMVTLIFDIIYLSSFVYIFRKIQLGVVKGEQ